MAPGGTGRFAAAVESGEEACQALEAVTLVTDLSADVNAANAAGETAVHAAASHKETSVACTGRCAAKV